MTPSFFISILILIPGLILIEGGAPKGSGRRNQRRKIQEVFVVQTSPESQKEVFGVDDVLGLDKNVEKLDKNFERRKRRREKKKVDKENCEKAGGCDKQLPVKEPSFDAPTWSPTASPVPTITAFPTREPISIFSVDPVSESETDNSSSGGQIFSVPTVAPQETPSTPTTIIFTASPAIPTVVINSPAERPTSGVSPLDSDRYEFPSNLASAGPSGSVTEEPSVITTEEPSANSSEEPSAVVSQEPSAGVTTGSPTDNAFVGEEDELELSIACESLKNGITHSTEHYIDVMYVYEVLTTATATLDTVLESIDEKVQSSMAQRFIPCETRTRRLQTLGVSLEQPNHMGSCTFLKAANTEEDDKCFLIQGSVKLYLSSDSQMTRDDASKMVFEFFLQSFNYGNNPSRSLLSSRNFIDAEKGILGVHFNGLVGEDGKLITDQSIFSAATRTRGAASGGSGGLSSFGIAMIAAACGCILLVGFVVVARVRSRKRNYGVELSDSEDEDSAALSGSGKLQVVETQDTLESAVSGLASFYNAKHDDKGEERRERPLFMNQDGGVVTSPPDFGVERPYVISDTVDL